MRLGKYGKILHHDRVALGANGYIDRYTLLELKFLGAIVLNVFNTTGPQDRWHTHAFNAVSIMLRGEYVEWIAEGKGTYLIRVRNRDIKFLPRTLNHNISRSSPNAMSITLCGPWKKTWTETKAGKTRTMGWGRKAV